MKRLFYSAIILTTCSAALATPVLFTMVSLTGSAADRSIQVTQPSSTPVPSIGGSPTNGYVPVPTTLQSVNGSVQANLAPGTYDIKLDGWSQNLNINVPNSASVVNASDIIETNDYNPLTIYSGPVTLNSYDFAANDFTVDSTGTNVSASTNLARIDELGQAAFVSTNIFLSTNTVVQETTNSSSIIVDATGKAIINVRTNSGVTDQQAAVISSSYTNLGIATANVCYLSQSQGSVTPVPGDPRYPFLTAQSAANACPSNGVVDVVDGTFNETVIVTNAQTWYFNDGTSLSNFYVGNGNYNFAVYGLGILGNGLGAANAFSNNYTNLRIECKSLAGQLFFCTSNNGATVTLAARDYLDGKYIRFQDTSTQTLYATAANITNLALTLPTGAGFNAAAPNKNYSLRATRQISFAFANAPSVGLTNCNIYLNAPRILFNTLNAARGNLVFFNPNCSITIEGADLGYLGGSLANIFKDSTSTNDVYFINDRLNLGAMYNNGVTAPGMVMAHFVGCVNTVGNPANSASWTNVSDNTIIDPTWTNALRF
jgi:hypothetical protein